jgi:metal-responsive CopG/Arc/MetJ family transcriptional regulator
VIRLKRTTIVADEALLLELKHRARREGRTVSELIREALEAYFRQGERKRTLSFVGTGRSGRKDISEKSEEILEQAFERSR